MSEQKKNVDSRMVAGGLCVTAGVLLGMGLGFAYHNFLAGLFIGLGGGFFLFALILVFKRG